MLNCHEEAYVRRPMAINAGHTALRQRLMDVQVPRIAATTIELLVQDAFAGAQHTTREPWWQSVRRMVLRAKELRIELARTEAHDQENEPLERMAIAVNFHKCSGQTQIMPATRSTQDAPPAPNRTLIRALAHPYRKPEGRPVERRSIPMRIHPAQELLGHGSHGFVHTPDRRLRRGPD